MKSLKIAFIGPDGAGKTTFINFFKNHLELEGKSVDCLFLGWRDFRNPILKIASKIYLKNKKNKEKERIDRYRERGWFFYLVYYSELLIRYLKVFHSKKDYVLFDRYFYDELLFSKGFKFKFFSKITPRPDLCIVLRPSFKLLKKRRQKVSEEKLNYFYEKLNKVSMICKTIFINNPKNPEKIYKDIKHNHENP